MNEDDELTMTVLDIEVHGFDDDKQCRRPVNMETGEEASDAELAMMREALVGYPGKIRIPDSIKDQLAEAGLTEDDLRRELMASIGLNS